MSELAELPKLTYLFQSYVQVVVGVVVPRPWKQWPYTPVVVVIVAVARAQEAVALTTGRQS